MAKIKAKTKDCQLTVRVKLSMGSKINDNEFDFFSRKYLRGFLKAKRIKKSVIEYSGPVGISLYERLKKPISKYDFFFIIEQIVDASGKLQKNALPWNKVIWDINYAYINETTKEVRFIYLPLENNTYPADIIGFLERIIYSSNPIDDKDHDFISRFVYFLKSLPSYDPTKIEAYINREDRSIVNTIKKHTTGGSGFMTDKPKDYYDHYDKKKDDEATDLLDDDATGLLKDEDEATGLLNEEDGATGLLVDGDEDTGLLTENDDEATGLLQENSVHYPSLYRVLTEETISVNKPVFRLGKERSYVDYFVTNNNAVSRSHADIITRGQKYFVIDLNSKNKTFINGEAIPVQCECEIFDGNRLVLGNEEFIFNV